MKQYRKIVLLLMAVSLTVGLAACGTEPESVPGTGTTQVPGLTQEPEETLTAPEAGDNDLVGTEWTLVSYGQPGSETAVSDSAPTTIQFEANGQVGGSGGCNSYGGQYQVDGDQITFSELVSTLIACEDEDLMAQEAKFLAALETASRYEMTYDGLLIYYDNGESVLDFIGGLGD